MPTARSSSACCASLLTRAKSSVGARSCIIRARCPTSSSPTSPPATATGASADAQDGDLVAVEVASSRSGYGLVAARVKERLGSLKSERAVSLIAINAHGIPHVFPPGVLKEAEAAEPARLAAGREDWRDVPLITIDPADAKDHDDAVHAGPDPDPNNRGGHVISVA